MNENQTFLPDIGISRGNREIITHFQKHDGDLIIYSSLNPEFQKPHSKGFKTIFIDFSWPEFPECKFGKWGRHPLRNTISEIIKKKQWSMFRSLGDVRKCETTAIIPKSLTTEEIWDQLDPEIRRYLSESKRSFCCCFLSLYYWRYVYRTRQMESKGYIENNDFNKKFMDIIRREFDALKTWMIPYVYVRIWENGTGVGEWDMDRLILLNVRLPQSDLYKNVLNSFKPIKVSSSKIHMKYDAEEEEKIRNDNPLWNWRD